MELYPGKRRMSNEVFTDRDDRTYPFNIHKMLRSFSDHLHALAESHDAELSHLKSRISHLNAALSASATRRCIAKDLHISSLASANSRSSRLEFQLHSLVSRLALVQEKADEYKSKCMKQGLVLDDDGTLRLEALVKSNRRLTADNSKLYVKISTERQDFEKRIAELEAQLAWEKSRNLERVKEDVDDDSLDSLDAHHVAVDSLEASNVSMPSGSLNKHGIATTNPSEFFDENNENNAKLSSDYLGVPLVTSILSSGLTKYSSPTKRKLTDKGMSSLIQILVTLQHLNAIVLLKRNRCR